MEAAVAAAVGRFNKGNFHMAEVMNMLSMDVNDFTISIVRSQNASRVKAADAAAEARFVQRRRRQRVQTQAARARQEDEEGLVYGQGMLEDQ